MTEQKKGNRLGRDTVNITANLPDVLGDALREYAQTREISVSTAIKRFVLEGLKAQGIDVEDKIQKRFLAHASARFSRGFGEDKAPTAVDLTGSQANRVAAPVAGQRAGPAQRIVTSETLPGVRADVADTARGGAVSANKKANAEARKRPRGT